MKTIFLFSPILEKVFSNLTSPVTVHSKVTKKSGGKALLFCQYAKIICITLYYVCAGQTSLQIKITNSVSVLLMSFSLHRRLKVNLISDIVKKVLPFTCPGNPFSATALLRPVDQAVHQVSGRPSLGLPVPSPPNQSGTENLYY